MRCPVTAVAAAGARTALESGLVGILDLADLRGLPAFAPGETVEVAVVRVDLDARTIHLAAPPALHP